MAELSEGQLKAYLDNAGGLCPSCESSNLDPAGFAIDVDTAVQVVYCRNCDARWEDEYVLNGVSNFEPGTAEEDEAAHG